MIFFPTDVTEQHYGIRIRGQHVTLPTTRVVAIAPNQSLFVCFIANEALWIVVLLWHGNYGSQVVECIFPQQICDNDLILFIVAMSDL